MAEHRGVSTKALWKNTTVTESGSGTAGPIDIRDISRNGDFSLSYYTHPAGGKATAGSAVFSYKVCPIFDGTYISPSTGTIGTAGGVAGTRGIVTFSPPAAPFMMFYVNVGTSGTALIDAELHVR